MNKKLLALVAVMGALFTCGACWVFASPIDGIKGRIANKDIAKISVHWMINNGVRGFCSIFESDDEGDFNALKYSVDDVTPVDTNLMAKVTSIGLAHSGFISIEYKDRSRDQVDIGCGYGYFPGGSRTVSSAFRSWGLTKWLMRVIDRSAERANIDTKGECFMVLAGGAKDQVFLKLIVKNKDIVKGQDIPVRIVVENTDRGLFYFYNHCAAAETLAFKMNDQWGRPGFSSVGIKVKDKGTPNESDFVALKPGETYACEVRIPGKKFMAGNARYYGEYLLDVTYENMASFDDYYSGAIAGLVGPTIHFAQSDPVEVNLVRDWDEFKDQMASLPKKADKERVGVFLGPPDNKIADFRDESGQPISDAFMSLDEWVYEQPLADKEGKRGRVIIKFKDDRMSGIKREMLE